MVNDKPTVYTTSSVYKEAGGGGGGGGDLPDGFKKCQYIEAVNVGNILFENSFNDLSFDDYIEILKKYKEKLHIFLIVGLLLLTVGVSAPLVIHNIMEAQVQAIKLESCFIKIG